VKAPNRVRASDEKRGGVEKRELWWVRRGQGKEKDTGGQEGLGQGDRGQRERGWGGKQALN
jgi:hypothetical protein